MGQPDDEEEEGGGGGWLVSFADLMTLLFAAFVVLYGLITPGTKETQMGVKAEIRASFTEISDSISPDFDYGKVKQGRYYFKAYYGETSRQTRKSNYKEDVLVAFDRDKNIVKNFIDQIAIEGGKEDLRFRQALNIDSDDKGITIRLYGAYFFAPGSYQIGQEARERFLKLGRVLKNIERPIVIEGHAGKSDNTGKIGIEELAVLRAANAVQILRNQLNFSPRLLEPLGFGASKLIATESDEHNRRIEIKVRYKR